MALTVTNIHTLPDEAGGKEKGIDLTCSYDALHIANKVGIIVIESSWLIININICKTKKKSVGSFVILSKSVNASKFCFLHYKNMDTSIYSPLGFVLRIRDNLIKISGINVNTGSYHYYHY